VSDRLPRITIARDSLLANRVLQFRHVANRAMETAERPRSVVHLNPQIILSINDEASNLLIVKRLVIRKLTQRLLRLDHHHLNMIQDDVHLSVATIDALHVRIFDDTRLDLSHYARSPSLSAPRKLSSRPCALPSSTQRGRCT